LEKTAFSVAQEKKLLDKLRSKRRARAAIRSSCAAWRRMSACCKPRWISTSGFQVFLVADATSSRHIGSRDVALSRLAHAGVVPVTSEMVAFEWTGDAKAKTFKTDQRDDPRALSCLPFFEPCNGRRY
jgi:hypothetical protein